MPPLVVVPKVTIRPDGFTVECSCCGMVGAAVTRTGAAIVRDEHLDQPHGQTDDTNPKEAR
jgi:hypothetical protein